MKQLVFAAMGLLAMFVAMRIDYVRYRDPRLILGLVGITLVALVAVLIVGPKINGTRRWFAVAGVGIQPSELAKLALILFTAAVLERRMDRIGEPKYAIGPIVVVLVPMLALIMSQPDYGSSVVLLVIVAAMVFAAGLPWRFIAPGALGIVPVVAAAALFSDYRVRRLTAFLDPWADREASGLPAGAVAHRRRVGRSDGERAGLQRAEARLPALPAHRLHLCRRVGGAGPGREPRSCWCASA